MKKMFKRIAYLLVCTVLVVGIFNALSARTVLAEGEQQGEIQEVEPENKQDEINATNDEESWSDFFADANNDQTVVVDTPEQLNQEQQMNNIEAAGGVGQSKDVYQEETQDETEDNPVEYTYKVINVDCDGNIVSEEEKKADKPTSDIIVKPDESACKIPTRPTTPDTSADEPAPVYDNTPAAAWVVYLGAVVLLGAIVYCLAKPLLAKKAVKQS